MTSLKAARADLAAKATVAVAAYDSVEVLAFEPPTLAGDRVTIATSGVTPTEWLLYIRVYVPAWQSEEGQDLLDDLVEALETVAESLSPTPRSTWDWVYDETKDTFLMTTTVAYGREDF